MSLSQQDKKHLRGIGHHLKTVLIAGDKGLSETFLVELDSRLEDHELIKVKVHAGTREQRAELISRLCDAAGAELVQRVGNVALLYRPARKPDPKLSNLLRNTE